MRAVELIGILESEEEVGGLRQAIAQDMPAFRRGLAIRGGSAPVRLFTEGRRIAVTERHVRQICDEYLAGRLDQEEMAYLMNALELCPDFEITSEELAEVIAALSEPLPDETLARQRVESFIRALP